MTDDDLPVVILPDNVNIQKVFFEPSHDPLAHQDDPIVEADELLLEDELEKELALGESALGGVFEMPRVCRNIALGTLAFLCLLFVIGKAYYALPLSARPLHYLHEVLRPSGFLGLAMGFLGVGLMFASLSYLLRKTLFLQPPESNSTPPQKYQTCDLGACPPIYCESHSMVGLHLLPICGELFGCLLKSLLVGAVSITY